MKDRMRPFYGNVIKRIFDVCVGLALAALLAPLVLLIWLMLRAQGKGAIFAHERIGRGGRVFRCYKFRTMIPDAERVLQSLLDRDPVAREEWARDHKLKCDPRVTAMGGFLRKTSLDELPQLWNVIVGDMSIVGPRPIVECELIRYGDAVNDYFSVRPGVTGLWQVSGRNHISYDERVALDSRYAGELGFWMDVSILLRTPLVILLARGAY